MYGEWAIHPGTEGIKSAISAGYSVYSPSKLTVGSGLKTFHVLAVGAYTVGLRVRATNYLTPTTYMEGIVISVTSNSIVVNVDTHAGVSGAGWNLSIANPSALDMAKFMLTL